MNVQPNHIDTMEPRAAKAKAIINRMEQMGLRKEGSSSESKQQINPNNK